MGKRTVGYRYKIGLHLVLCHGPVDAVQEIQVGDRTAWGNADRGPLAGGHGLTNLSINKPDLFGGDSREGGVVGTIDVMPGGSSQQRNDYLMGRLGSDIPAFRGVLSLVARQIQYSANNPYLKPWAVRARRFTAGWHSGAWLPQLAEVKVWDEGENREITVGMNPAHIIVQCLTDPGWGMGYPQAVVGESFQVAAEKLYQEGFGLNFVWTRQESIESFIETVLDHVGGVLYVDPQSGKFELKLLRSDYSIDELPRLGSNEIVSLDNFERLSWGELPNEITVVYTDWQAGKEATVTVQNLASVQLQGGVINQRRNYPGVNYGPLAARLALRDLQLLGSPISKATLTVAAGKLQQPLLPGDAFVLNWPRLGIDRIVMRVASINTGGLGAAEWRIEAIEDAFSLDYAVLTTPPAAPEEPSLEPQPPALVLAVETPYWELARRLSRADLDYLTDTDTYVSALAAAGGEGQLNWQLAVGPASDSVTVIASEDYAPLFKLNAPLPASEVDAIGVPITVISNPERLAVGDYAYLVDAAGEIREAVAILAYDAVAGTVDLARGVLDTTPKEHAANAWLIGVGEWAAFDTTDRVPNEAVFVGAIPVAPAGQGALALAANGQPITLVGRQARPYPPGRVRLNGQIEPPVVAGDLVVEWAHRDRAQQTAYLVRQDEGDIGPEPGTTYVVRIRDRNGALVRTATGLAGTAWTWNVASAAADAGTAGDRVTVEIEAERDGLASWQPQVRTVDRAGYGLRWGQYYGGV